MSGGQGLSGHGQSACKYLIPTKKPRKANLDASERQHNRLLARLRVVIEHVNRRMKIFRILAERYRNRRRRYGLRFNLIAAIINLELTYP
jgi:hypothetical protein